MKKNRALTVISLFLLALICTSVVGAAPAYTLQQGDTLEVSVWGEENLTRQLRVLPDGSVTFPLVGRLEVVGKSSTQVEQQLTKKLAEFIPDAEVTVVITNIEGNSIFILGKVVKPGEIVMPGPISVLQALSIAGGLDKFADRDEIKIIRGKGSNQKIMPVNYKGLIDGKDLSTNYQLKAGDTLLVP
jgi:polysaccharide export outer membrane protein